MKINKPEIWQALTQPKIYKEIFNSYTVRHSYSLILSHSFHGKRSLKNFFLSFRNAILSAFLKYQKIKQTREYKPLSSDRPFFICDPAKRLTYFDTEIRY